MWTAASAAGSLEDGRYPTMVGIGGTAPRHLLVAAGNDLLGGEHFAAACI